MGEALLRVHPSFLKQVEPLLKNGLIKGMSHITGGGFLDDVPGSCRRNPESNISSLLTSSAVFNFLQKIGEIPRNEMYRTFNME